MGRVNNQLVETDIWESAVVTSNGAIYAAGDAIGAVLSLTDTVDRKCTSGTITAITICDKGKQAADIDVVFFSADPAGTTVTDNAALTIADADLVKILPNGVAEVTDHASFADNSVSIKSVNIPFQLASNTLYAVLVARGTPTYASAGDLYLRVGIAKD